MDPASRRETTTSRDLMKVHPLDGPLRRTCGGGHDDAGRRRRVRRGEALREPRHRGASQTRSIDRAPSLPPSRDAPAFSPSLFCSTRKNESRPDPPISPLSPPRPTPPQDGPRCMLELGFKPMVWYALQTLEKGGVRDVILVAAGEANAAAFAQWIADEIGTGETSSLVVSVVAADEDADTADALRAALPKLTTPTVTVISGDLVTDVRLEASSRQPSRRSLAFARVVLFFVILPSSRSRVLADDPLRPSVRRHLRTSSRRTRSTARSRRASSRADDRGRRSTRRRAARRKMRITSPSPTTRPPPPRRPPRRASSSSRATRRTSTRC